jgi:preprotein translocase subunit YajC
MKLQAKANRNCGNATSVRVTIMDFLVAFISIGAAAWFFMWRFERRLETQHGPWIAQVQH